MKSTGGSVWNILTGKRSWNVKMDAERIACALDGLSEVQRRRLLMFADGKSIREIAREECGAWRNGGTASGLQRETVPQACGLRNGLSGRFFCAWKYGIPVYGNLRIIEV